MDAYVRLYKHPNEELLPIVKTKHTYMRTNSAICIDKQPYKVFICGFEYL